MLGAESEYTAKEGAKFPIKWTGMWLLAPGYVLPLSYCSHDTHACLLPSLLTVLPTRCLPAALSARSLSCLQPPRPP